MGLETTVKGTGGEAEGVGRAMLEYCPQHEENLLQLGPPTSEKEAQCSVACFGFWKQPPDQLF